MTNEVGLYTLPLLQPGQYVITASHAGFKPVTESGVTLEVDQRAEINFRLEVGAQIDKVEVNAVPLQLNTVEASQGQVIENQRIVEMPLNGRLYSDLALFTAGTAPAPPNSRFTGFSSGGQRVTQNNFMLDGIDNNSVELAGAGRRAEMVQPSIDAIQEFKVQTNAYAAEYGRAMGSVVNVTLKSGSNEIHGTAFEFLRNEKLDARNFFTPTDAAKPPFKRNQYGLALGFPILIPKLYNGRNKTFLFGDFEGTRIRQTSTITSNIPTLKMRSGDFSELLAVRNKRITDPVSGQPFAGNIIPPSRLDPVARALINLYPVPQNSAIASNYVFLSPQNQDVDKWDVRADQIATSNDNLFFRFSRQDVNTPDTASLPAPAFGGGNLDSVTLGYNTGVGWNRVFTPNLIMSARAGWNYTLFDRNNPASTAGALLNARYGIKGGDNTIPGGFSQMTISGYRALGIGGFNPVARDSQNRQITGDLTWIHVRHILKTGAGLLRSQNNIYNIRNAIGNYNFSSQYTGDGAADFLIGWSNSWSWNSPVNVQLRAWNLSAFVQDDWKLSNRLTVNLGVRYEASAPWLEKHNKMGVFDIDTDPAHARMVIASRTGSRYDRALVAIDGADFMPRIGFAFKLTDKTVIRSGYGLFYAYMEPFGDNEFLIGNPPFAYGVTLSGSTTAPGVFLASGPSDGATNFVTAKGLQFNSFQRNPDMSSAHQWNFDVQRQFGDWLFEVGYAGSRGLHLVRQYDSNFSAPGPGALNDKRFYKSVEIPGTGVVASPLAEVYGHRFDGNSNYHALLSKLDKRFSSGFTVLASYTFSKAIGDTCGASAQGGTVGCGYQDARNMKIEKARDNTDIPHRFSSSVLYDLPFGKGRTWGSASNRFIQSLLGGWTTGSIVVVSSGLPFSATTQGNPANSGTVAIINRPDVVGDPLSGSRTLQRDFNTDAFVPNRQFQTGNAGRNILRQRGLVNWDFSALKNWQIREYLRLQFRFEGFHFSNTPRFGVPGNVVGTSNFGVITSAETPRNLQFGLKLIW